MNLLFFLLLHAKSKNKSSSPHANNRPLHTISSMYFLNLISHSVLKKSQQSFIAQRPFGIQTPGMIPFLEPCSNYFCSCHITEYIKQNYYNIFSVICSFSLSGDRDNSKKISCLEFDNIQTSSKNSYQLD